MPRRLLPILAAASLVAAAALTAPLDAQRRGARRAASPPAPEAEARPARPGTSPPPGTAPASAPAGPALDAPLPGALSPRNASYVITATLDPSARTITGRERLTWRNIARTPATELRFHLYYNAWKNSRSTWMREAILAGRRGGALPPSRDDWGWTEVTALRLPAPDGSTAHDLTAQARFVAPDDGNADDETVMAVPLPAPIAGGQSIEVDIEWTARVPRTFSRTGAVGRSFFLAQWFPKIGVFEESGWNCHQFHAGTEFFADYGVYDVTLTVPRGWIVGASGQARGTRDEGALTSHRYLGEDIHDFAWTTSPDYLVRTATFEEAPLPKVAIRLLLQPEHAGQAERHFAATRAALLYYGRWFGAYPYGYLTVVDPAWRSGAGGMEYPTLFTAGSNWIAPARANDPEAVTVHECGHQFWYGIVGNNEFEHAWLDEGLNTYSTGAVMERFHQPNYLEQRFFGGFIPLLQRDAPLLRDTFENGLESYRTSAIADTPATPSYRYWPGTGGGISYSKTALWLHTLERHLGTPVMRRILSTYFERWKFRHPKPGDLFAVINEVSGRDMTWFIDQVHRGSDIFDYGIQQLTSVPAGGAGWNGSGSARRFADAPSGPPYRTTVVLRRYGGATFPVDFEVSFEDGSSAAGRWDGRERWAMFTFDRPARARAAVVDPRRVLLLDVNRTNNSRTLEPASGRASSRWALKWMIWLEDLLMNGAFFV